MIRNAAEFKEIKYFIVCSKISRALEIRICVELFWKSFQVVEKTDPFEQVGVICQTLHGVHVVEYSDLPAEVASARDDSGRLKFRAGNIASHFFTCDFVHAGL